MPWPGILLRIALFFLSVAVTSPGVQAEGNVGCLFSERLCLEDEWCYDDYAFGRCLPPAGDVDEDDLYRYDLEREVLHLLSRELRRLFALGYRWSHGYTQCRLQAMLYTTKHDVFFDSNSCSHLVDQDLEGALKALEGQDPLDPREMAIVKYTPSVENPHADFADEVYYPPSDDTLEQSIREKILAPNAIDIYDMEDPYAQMEEKRGWIPQMHRRSLPFQTINSFNPDSSLEFLPNPPEDDIETQFLKNLGVPPHFQKDLPPEQFINLVKQLGASIPDNIYNPFERFALTYNTPDSFRAGWESRDSLPEPRIYFDENEDLSEYGSGYDSLLGTDDNIRTEIFRELKHRHENDNGIYTEGGVVYPPHLKPKNKIRDDINKLMNKYGLGFKRPERLDVKKPGPLFDVQVSDEKRGLSGTNEPLDTGYIVDTDYVYVQFKQPVHKWEEGQSLIGNITKLLKLEPGVLSHARVDRNEVTFKVAQNSRNLNSTQIVENIDAIRDELEYATGFEVTSVGIGDKTKMRTLFAGPTAKDGFYIVIFMVWCVLGAMIVAAAVLLLIRRHLKSKEKLQGLSRPDTEASKDYQDLCRARMSAKSQPAGDSVHGRITSLSRESEQSPSSRSSTSSWSEEPALHNMDISTGHMVLSYMEDHLKNKDRLEQEWIALCAYVAEPCETTIAHRKDNLEKNRYHDVVPYDHSRVVLNELTNLSGFDYINASSITDHDPRNPAYIATQGPLPQTAPDFWQLIWEQGAVVIVMLSRLTEGGAAMCHRYWPEEGSELYHIYEVHLVSEHIWCDDYLVRSFYLKNVKTGETRTVTQFHFLSWSESGVPGSTKALLEFRRKVNKSYRGRSCPIVVHCSDGAGRTGTYCLIDMVLSRMAKGAKEIDIAATLEHLRDQRPRMVSTKQQFEFVLTAVAEEVHAILKALPPPQPEKQ